MKWLLGTALVIATTSITGSAQAMKDQMKPMKDSAKMANVSHTGCLEAAAGGGFVLTHVDAAGHSSMKAADQSSTSMTMAHDDKMAHDMPKSGMNADHMMSDNVRLIGLSNLDKHVGQKVAIRGSLSHDSVEEMASTIAVSSLKVVSKSCS